MEKIIFPEYLENLESSNQFPLSEWEYAVFCRRHFENKTFKEIGNEIRLTEARVSQIYKNAAHNGGFCLKFDLKEILTNTNRNVIFENNRVKIDDYVFSIKCSFEYENEDKRNTSFIKLFSMEEIYHSEFETIKNDIENSAKKYLKNSDNAFVYLLDEENIDVSLEYKNNKKPTPFE